MNKVRQKRCKECKELFTPRYSSVQMVCSPSCAIAYSKRIKTNKKEQNNALLTDMSKEINERKGLTTVLNSVKNACHKYIRERDKGKPCVSCGTQWHKDFHAGHYYKAEIFSSIKFNEYNINGQCVKCNIRKEGNLNDYEINLPNRIGIDSFKALKQLAILDRKQTNFKWDREELKRIRLYYNKKFKEITNIK
jgi:hypothetical protein